MSNRTRVGIVLSILTLAMLPLTVQAKPKPAVAKAAIGSDLSAAQQSRANARQEKFRKDTLALRASPKLTEAQKQAKYKTLMQAMDKDMLAILTPAQRVEVIKQRQINDQYQKSLVALQNDSTLTDAQKQAKYKALTASRQTALLATLTPSQRARVEKEHQAQLTQAAAANKLGEELEKSQTPDQKKKIDAISTATRTKMQAVIADKSVSDQAKVAKINALRQQAQTQITALLTPEQKAKYARLQALVSTAPKR